MQKPRPGHVTHLLLTVLTCGLWLFVYVPLLVRYRRARDEEPTATQVWARAKARLRALYGAAPRSRTNSPNPELSVVAG